MDRRKRRIRRLGAGIVCAALVLLGSSSGASDSGDYYPGLPNPTFTSGGWSIVSQTGMAGAAKAKQWVRVPPTTVAAWIGDLSSVLDPEDPAVTLQSVGSDAYLVSPKGAPDPYGHMEPMTIRSVGFGMIPIEATVQVSQRRRNGLPIPLKARVENRWYGPPESRTKLVLEDTIVDDAFNVRILEVLVDGVNIGLQGNCRTAKPAPVRLVGPGHTVPNPIRRQEWYAEQDPATYFNPNFGGQLRGSMDIPAFTGCITRSGDDLSAMITTAVSGPGNESIVTVAYPCARYFEGTSWPPAPGESTPATSGCPAPPPLPYPERKP